MAGLEIPGGRWYPVIGQVPTPHICLGLSAHRRIYRIAWEFLDYQWATLRSAAIQDDFRNAHFEIIQRMMIAAQRCPAAEIHPAPPPAQGSCGTSEQLRTKLAIGTTGDACTKLRRFMLPMELTGVG